MNSEWTDRLEATAHNFCGTSAGCAHVFKKGANWSRSQTIFEANEVLISALSWYAKGVDTSPEIAQTALKQWQRKVLDLASE